LGRKDAWQKKKTLKIMREGTEPVGVLSLETSWIVFKTVPSTTKKRLVARRKRLQKIREETKKPEDPPP